MLRIKNGEEDQKEKKVLALISFFHEKEGDRKNLSPNSVYSHGVEFLEVLRKTFIIRVSQIDEISEIHQKAIGLH